MRLNEVISERIVFNGANYQDWSTSTMFFLMEKGFWRVVEEDPLALKENEEEDSSSYKLRVKNNRDLDMKARGRIGGTIGMGYIEQIRACETAAQMWHKLKQLFLVSSNNSKMMALKNLLSEKLKHGQNVVEFLGSQERWFRLAHPEDY